MCDVKARFRASDSLVLDQRRAWLQYRLATQVDRVKASPESDECRLSIPLMAQGNRSLSRLSNSIEGISLELNSPVVKTQERHHTRQVTRCFSFVSGPFVIHTV